MMDRPIVTGAAEALYERLEPLARKDEENDWALLRFCEALAGTLQERYLAWVSETDEHPSWGIIMDVDSAPEDVLPWLAQFVGVQLTENMDEEAKREAIRVHAGFQRGTPAAILAEAKRWLTGSKHVTMNERAGGEAYQLLIRTFTEETPDEDAVRAAILSQKPAGIVLDYAAVDGEVYSTLLSEYDDYADMLDNTDSYVDLLH